MDEHFRWWAWAGLCALALGVVLGPLVAGFALAGAAFMFMFGVMGARVVRLVGDWRLEHPHFGHLRLRSRRLR